MYMYTTYANGLPSTTLHPLYYSTPIRLLYIHSTTTQTPHFTPSSSHTNNTQQVQQAAWDFVVRRLEQLLVDEGLRVEAVRAVLSQRGNNPALAAASARNAHAQLQQGDGALLQRVLAAMARPVRIMRGKDVDQDVQVGVGGGLGREGVLGAVLCMCCVRVVHGLSHSLDYTRPCYHIGGPCVV